MRIRELTIRNYRAFAEPPTFRFAERFTVVAGVNGRGKTGMLDGLALLASRFLPHVSPGRSGYRTIGQSDVHTDASYAQLAMKANCAGIPVEYRLTYIRDTGKITATSLSQVLKREIRNAYGDPGRADDAAPLAVYYTTDRAGYRLPKKLPTNLPCGQAAAYTGALFNRTVNFRDFLARYRSATVLDEEARRTDRYFIGGRAVEAISNAITTFLDGFSNLRVEMDPPRLLIDKEGNSLDLSQLSDGERSFLALVCDLGRRLALANPLLPNPLDGAGVVLIDELELHLHPRWQREVRKKLVTTFPNIQFIATTHSPFVIQSLEPGELINLDPDESWDYSDKSIDDISENVMGVELPQKSERFLLMMEAAEAYFRLLQDGATDEESVAAAEQRLNELSTPYSDDPAFQALLRLERESQRGGGNAPS